jgi:23S rRNA pseudouridine1911/1915/1917 synthase
MVAKSDSAHRGLSEQLAARRVQRRYVALVWGRLPESGTIDAAIDRNPRDRKRMAVVERGGRRAVTRFRRLQEMPFLSLCELQLETGRTHQIRVHLQHLGHPVFGDPAYGGRTRSRGIDPGHRPAAQRLLEQIDRQALHAATLGFVHPRTGADLEFESPWPSDLARAVQLARSS